MGLPERETLGCLSLGLLLALLCLALNCTMCCCCCKSSCCSCRLRCPVPALAGRSTSPLPPGSQRKGSWTRAGGASGFGSRHHVPCRQRGQPLGYQGQGFPFPSCRGIRQGKGPMAMVEVGLSVYISGAGAALLIVDVIIGCILIRTQKTSKTHKDSLFL